jgi:hypothetical protein
VGCHIVKLTSDPGPLHADRQVLALLALVRERQGPVLELRVQPAPGA